MSNFSHIPVLLDEAIDALMVAPNKKYIDATLGGAGHTALILEKGGIVLGIDKDTDALESVKEKFGKEIDAGRLKTVHGSFSNIKKIAEENGFEKVSGILFDVGVSSYQLDNSGRGFSIRHDEKLDMRMDSSASLTAYDVVNSYPVEKLIEIFYRYGEEHNAKEIAQVIGEKRRKEKITTTKELAQIAEGISHRSEAIHPATRIFQAIRIEVNGELEELKRGLTDGLELLETKGRLVAISFHSLEDRVVKQSFETFVRGGIGIVVNKKPIIANFNEVKKNKRSRSAKMRVFEKK